MLVNRKWLEELVDIPDSSQDLAEKMSTTGIEVEHVYKVGEGLSKVVVGEVLSCELVPETHLHVCQVNVGEDAPRQIVCGAPNIRPNIKVIVALPGARIGGNHKIKKGRIRGVDSLGMICSLEEIGVPASVISETYADGIQILPDDAAPGEDVLPILGLDETMIALAITPNRADALSMRGVAHEVAAIYGTKVHFSDYSLKEAGDPIPESFLVQLDTPKVISYQGRLVRGVLVSESPQWLQNRLMNAGIRPINNIVDITNYIMLEFGYPLHAYDAQTLGADGICVRQAKEGECITTLDGQERRLLADDIVIASDGSPQSLAGVMGGLASQISSDTQDVFLEAATFDATSIRQTASRHNLRSESSSRFEKGINKADSRKALDAAASLLEMLAGGVVANSVLMQGDLDASNLPVSVSLEMINRSLGTDLSEDEVLAIFDRLEMTAQFEAGVLMVSVPARRWDIRIPADLIEEVARIYGYHRLPATLPTLSGKQGGHLTAKQALKRHLQDLAEGSGLTEVVTYALMRPEKATAFTRRATSAMMLLWPMTEDRSVLRQNMVAGLLEVVSYNQARQQKDLAIYEISTVFEKGEGHLPKEVCKLAIAMTGLVAKKDFQTEPIAVDFYHLKGILDMMVSQLGIALGYEPVSDMPDMHPGRTARLMIGGEEVGFVGQVHPEITRAHKMTDVYVAELSVDSLLVHKSDTAVYTAIPKYPAVTRDIAVLLDETVTHQEVLTSIMSAGVKSLQACLLFDSYSGDEIASGKKSMAYRLTFQKGDDSLTDDEVQGYMIKISKALASLGAEVR